MTREALIISTVLLAADAGCPSPTSHNPDAGAPDQTASHVPDAGARDRAITDSGQQLEGVVVDMVFPPHLRTNCASPDLQVVFKVNPLTQADLDVAEAQLKAGFSLVALPSKTPVPGTWTFDKNWMPWTASYKPSVPLQNDTDYLVHVPQTGRLVPLPEYGLFRPGSLPRVAQISFQASSSKPGELDLLLIRFSEAVDAQQAAAAIAVKLAATKAPLATALYAKTPTTHPTDTVTLQLPPGTAMTSKLAITVGTDIGAPTGVKLDGTYSGVAGSAPLSVELVPADYGEGKSAKHWEPTLPF